MTNHFETKSLVELSYPLKLCETIIMHFEEIAVEETKNCELSSKAEQICLVKETMEYLKVWVDNQLFQRRLLHGYEKESEEK